MLCVGHIIIIRVYKKRFYNSYRKIIKNIIYMIKIYVVCICIFY